MDQTASESRVGLKFVVGGGDNGYGSGIVTSLKTFDREQRKEYHIPIVIRDSGSPSSRTTTTPDSYP